MAYSRIFGTGLARSGGGLYSMCLSTHPQMMVACCPNIELFRSFRNAMIRDIAEPELAAACGPDAPLQDWYGTDRRLRLFDHLLEKASLDLPFDAAEWPSFLETSVRRGALETADLVVNYGKLAGATYRNVFDNLLAVIAETRRCADRKWVGLHETWILDFYPLLARAYPDAKFLVMFRDPRAIVNSMLGVEAIDPTQVAQTLSYVRHWRKYAALASRYSRDPLFRGRLHVTAHDLILTKPAETLAGICAAFDLDLDPRMLDTQNFHNYATGETWTGNSSFESMTKGISAHRALRWRAHLAPEIQATIEYLCGPDLRLVGYPTFTKYADPAEAPSEEIVRFLLKDHAAAVNWRSDLGDPIADFGLEALRRQLLTLSAPCQDVGLVRRAFLFDDVYRVLRAPGETLIPALGRVL